MTALLSGVVLVMVLCHTPKTIINAYESYQVSYFNFKVKRYRGHVLFLTIPTGWEPCAELSIYLFRC